jgi:hypothetical protein
VHTCVYFLSFFRNSESLLVANTSEKATAFSAIGIMFYSRSKASERLRRRKELHRQSLMW